jgi:hypothetical protein
MTGARKGGGRMVSPQVVCCLGGGDGWAALSGVLGSYKLNLVVRCSGRRLFLRAS